MARPCKIVLTINKITLMAGPCKIVYYNAKKYIFKALPLMLTTTILQ
jgi:hypothetical protein